MTDLDVIAHRGFAGRYPENTLAAVRAAVPDADAIELDVLPTADGTPVVVHDERLGGREGGGLTDAHGVVWETSTHAVTAAEVLASGETVPTLADAVATVPADVGLHVELKNPGTAEIRPGEVLDGTPLDRARERWAPFVARVLDDLADAPHDVCYSSFCEGALAAVRERSSAPVAPLARTAPEAALTVARRYDAAAIHPHWSLVAGTPFAGGPGGAGDVGHVGGADRGGRERGAEADADVGGPRAVEDVGGPRAVEDADGPPAVDVVARAHDAGRAVNAWPVDTWYRADRLRAAGVDGIVADYPCLASPP